MARLATILSVLFIAVSTLLILTSTTTDYTNTHARGLLAFAATPVDIRESLSNVKIERDERKRGGPMAMADTNNRGGEDTDDDDDNSDSRRAQGNGIKHRSQSRSLSPSLSPSAAILGRKKAFTRHPTTGVPKLTDDELEVLADQVFDGIVTEIHYHDHKPFKDHKSPQQRVWTDRYYRITVLVTTVVHLRDRPLATLSHSEYELKKIADENEKYGGVREHAHKIEEGQLVDVLMWEALKRPDLGPAAHMMKGLEIGFVLIPKRADPDVEYRFFTQGIAHRMQSYRESYPTAGLELPAFEALIPNGVQVVKEDGSGDDTPMKERKSRSQSIRWDL